MANYNSGFEGGYGQLFHVNRGRPPSGGDGHAHDGHAHPPTNSRDSEGSQFYGGQHYYDADSKENSRDGHPNYFTPLPVHSVQSQKSYPSQSQSSHNTSHWDHRVVESENSYNPDYPLANSQGGQLYGDGPVHQGGGHPYDGHQFAPHPYNGHQGDGDPYNGHQGGGQPYDGYAKGGGFQYQDPFAFAQAQKMPDLTFQLFPCLQESDDDDGQTSMTSRSTMHTDDSRQDDERYARLHPSTPLGIAARLIYFGALYIACVVVYYYGIQKISTAVTRFEGTPLERTDFRSALRFIQDTYDRKWYFCFGVLFTTTMAIPLIKFIASLLILTAVACPEIPMTGLQRLADRVMHVVASYQMADVFVACLLVAFLNVKDVTSVVVHDGFYLIAAFVLLSIIFQTSAEVVRMKGRCIERISHKIDRVNVVIVSVWFLSCFWLSMTYEMLEIWFNDEQMVIERTKMTLLQSVSTLNDRMPSYVTVLYVFFLIIAPNLYVICLLLLALSGGCVRKDRGPKALTANYMDDQLVSPQATVSSGLDRGRSRLVPILEFMIFWLRPVAMYDEFVLMLWVVLFTLRVENITAVEAHILVPQIGSLPAFSSLKLMSVAAIALFVLRWFWGNSRCLPRRYTWIKSVGVFMGFVMLYLLPTPQRPHNASDVMTLNTWLVHIRKALDSKVTQPENPDAVTARGNCSAFNASAYFGKGPGKCEGDGPLYVDKDDGSDLAIQWVTGLSTGAVTSVEVSPQAGGYLIEVELEMQMLIAELKGNMCKPGLGCGAIASTVTYGRQWCKNEAFCNDWCYEDIRDWKEKCGWGTGACASCAECPAQSACNCPAPAEMVYGYQEDGLWLDPKVGPQVCSVDTWDARSSPVYTIGGSKRCYCVDPRWAKDTEPRRATLQISAACTLPSCEGTEDNPPIASLSVQSVAFNSLMINVPVNLNVYGVDVSIRNNWTDASSLLENLVRDKLTPYLTGETELPYLKNQKTLDIINRLMVLNAEVANR